MKRSNCGLLSGGAIVAWSLVGPPQVMASTVFYVSPTGNDASAGTVAAPFKTLGKAASKTLAGDAIVLLAGSYIGQWTLTDTGTQANPIRIQGENAVFASGALVVRNSQWLTLEGLSFTGGTNQITVEQSHYIAFRNNRFDFLTRALYLKDYSSHILVEDNEFLQSCVLGKTWTQVKGSACEGGAVSGTSYGGGSYAIRNNRVHDVFNAFLFTDDTTGQWMNANIFISGNRFERVVDDPAEPEGDSFNFHFFSNTLFDTHRMISLTTKGLGPIFVYNNVQITTGNPTAEPSRLNSAFKLDLSRGFANGVFLFNNTIVGEGAANFYAYDMLSRKIATPLTARNNVYVTLLTAFSKTPSGGSFDYDISKSPFGMTQLHGIVDDPQVQADGSLAAGSPAIGWSTDLRLPGWFDLAEVVPAGANLGAFQNIPEPTWVMPPRYPVQKIPDHIPGWVDALSVSSSL